MHFSCLSPQKRNDQWRDDNDIEKAPHISYMKKMRHSKWVREVAYVGNGNAHHGSSCHHVVPPSCMKQWQRNACSSIGWRRGGRERSAFCTFLCAWKKCINMPAAKQHCGKKLFLRLSVWQWGNGEERSVISLFASGEEISSHSYISSIWRSQSLPLYVSASPQWVCQWKQCGHVRLWPCSL